MIIESLTADPAPGPARLDAGDRPDHRATPGPAGREWHGPRGHDEGVAALEGDAEHLHEHLRPAWHVVAATGVVLAAAVLVSWLGS